MTKLQQLQLGACILFGLCIFCPAGEEKDKVAEQASAIFTSVESKYDTIKSLQYDVTRRVSTQRQTVEDQWSFCFVAPDRVRIDVHSPYERTIIIDDNGLTEYVPLRRKVVVTEWAKRNRKERDRITGSALSRVALEGMRIGSYAEMAARADRIVSKADRPGEVTVEGTNPAYRVTVDTNRLVLLAMEVRDTKGHVIVSAEAADFLEASSGFWMPTRLVWAQAGSDDVLYCEARLTNVFANTNIPPSRFIPEFPAGTSVERR